MKLNTYLVHINTFIQCTLTPPPPPSPLGILGLNNIKANDYMNVILHTLAHISPFRDYFLREDNYLSITPPPGDQTFTLGKRNNIIQGLHKGVRDVTSHHSA